MSDSYDAVVIGAGAGGGIVACVLAEAGQRVLLLERGKKMGYADVGRDHLRNERFARYGHNTGPELQGNPRVYIDPAGKRHISNAIQPGYNNNAMVLGGGTLVYGAQAWRFLPDDFRMATRYGVPKGSSLADWPIRYEDLTPYYEKAEWEIGVAGDGDAAGKIWNRRKGFPLPPLPDRPTRLVMRAAAEKLGWSSMALPVLINTEPYNGRAACSQCGSCVGFACPSDGKNGSQNTVIPRALATGNCELLTETQAERLDLDDRGDVIGVTFVSMRDGKIERRSVRAKRVVLSAGAIESTRLLLNSATKHHPNGLGNGGDHVGRHLQGHVYVGAHGIMDEPVYDGHGPGVTIATTQFNHGNAGIIGGGLMADEFIKLPIGFYYGCFPPGSRRWGLSAKKFVRDNYTRNIHIQGPVQEIPNPDSRVEIDPTVKDCFGIPVVKLSGTIHPATLDVGRFMHERAEQWLHAAGASGVWGWHPEGLGLSGGQHQAGTARMGTDEKDSVTNAWGRVHGHDNLFVADGSLHVNNGGFNPVLTIMALAYRVADGILRG
ncbi:GMC family oxidoreductase [soil metagenome]